MKSTSSTWYSLSILLCLTSGLSTQDQINHKTVYPKAGISYDVIYKWKELDLQFTSAAEREEMIQTEQFIPKNNIPIGMKVHKNRMFLSLPRLRTGVPSTLNYVNLNSTETFPTSPILIPYPDWESQKLENCKTFQSIHSMEVDQFDRLWIIDTGRNPANKSSQPCLPKLVIMDLNSDKIISTHEFEGAVVSSTEGYLNDIVVACSSRDACYAHITNSGQNMLTVFSLADNKSWGIFHSTMLPDPTASNITILGKPYSLAGAGVNGIAISSIDSKFDRLYYAPQSSFELFSTSTDVLKNSSSNGVTTIDDSDVRHHGRKRSQAAGMILDAKNQMYFTVLSQNAVGYWNTSLDEINEQNEVEYIQRDEELEWPDTFSFDNEGNLFVTSTKVNRFNSDTLIPGEYQFRVLRVSTGTQSYMYSDSGQNFCSRMQAYTPIVIGLASLFVCMN